MVPTNDALKTHMVAERIQTGQRSLRIFGHGLTLFDDTTPRIEFSVSNCFDTGR